MNLLLQRNLSPYKSMWLHLAQNFLSKKCQWTSPVKFFWHKGVNKKSYGVIFQNICLSASVFCSKLPAKNVIIIIPSEVWEGKWKQKMSLSGVFLVTDHCYSRIWSQVRPKMFDLVLFFLFFFGRENNLTVLLFSREHHPLKYNMASFDSKVPVENVDGIHPFKIWKNKDQKSSMTHYF